MIQKFDRLCWLSRNCSSSIWPLIKALRWIFDQRLCTTQVWTWAFHVNIKYQSLFTINSSIHTILIYHTFKLNDGKYSSQNLKLDFEVPQRKNLTESLH